MGTEQTKTVKDVSNAPGQVSFLHEQMSHSTLNTQTPEKIALSRAGLNKSMHFGKDQN